MTIYSLHKLSELDIKKIKDIFKQSKCPQESLKFTFKNFTKLTTNNVIIFDNVDVNNPNVYITKI